MSVAASSGRPPAIRLDRFRSDMAALGLVPRVEQEEVSSHLAVSSDAGDGMVSFIEAPTATGKTLCMAQHALERVSLDPSRAWVIAVPSIEIAQRTIAEVDRLKEAVPAYRAMRTSAVFGRQEFVSHDLALDLATSLYAQNRDQEAEAIEAWLDRGAPGATPSAQAYTRAGLLATTGGRVEAPAWISLDHADADDPASRHHRAQSQPADLLVVTHAMLARDMIRRYIGSSILARRAGVKKTRGSGWEEEAARQRLEFETEVEGHLPEYRRLIVDEAHLLESNIKAALTSSLSIRQVANAMENIRAGAPRSMPSDAVARVRAAYDELVDLGIGRSHDEIRIDWLDPKGFDRPLATIREAVDSVKRSAKGPEAALREVSRARHALREALGARDSVTTLVSWSPSRSFPSVGVGPRSIGVYMKFLWGRLESTALVSATLYTENVDGPSASFMAETLRVGPDARMTFPPVRSGWAMRAIVNHPVSPADPDLVPRDDSEGREVWLDAVADRIAAAHAVGDAGTLVLNRSRAVTTALHARLVRLLGEDAHPVLDGSSQPVQAMRMRFEILADEGRRPIWLAHGQAWTGLDLKDESLGTLVIPRLPFPPPRPGATDGSGPSYDGEQVARMMITLKQGIGRLVRSVRPRTKSLHVLDGRIGKGGPANAAKTILDQFHVE